MEIFPKELLAQCYCGGCEEPSDIIWFNIIGTKYWITKDDGGFSYAVSYPVGGWSSPARHCKYICFEEFFDGVDGEFKDILIFNLNDFRPRDEF
jgi:hypothetical protein